MKSGKITIQVTDYNQVKHYSELMDMDITETTQIGQEVQLGLMYRDLTQVFKLGQCSKLPLVAKEQTKPSTVATGSKATKK